MRITDVECIPVQSPGRTFVIILVSTDDGLIGVGEAGLQRRPRALKGAVEHLRRWLVGEDPMRIEYLWQRMYRGGFYPADRLIGSAAAAIDIALWDILGQALGAPIYQLLGGRCRDSVQCFLNNSIYPPGHSYSDNDLSRYLSQGDPSAAAEKALVQLDTGHKYFRLSPPTIEGQPFNVRQAARQLLEQIRAVRAAVGEQMELMVDLHARFSLAEAVWFCREVEPLNLFMVEDPIRSEFVGGYRKLRSQVRVPLAAGEQWASKWEFRQAIEENLIDYARVDICIAGGLSEAKKIAALAETHMIRILPHNPLGPVCTAASLHLDLAVDNAGPQEIIFHPNHVLPDVFECAFQLEGTRLSVPEAPGLGVRFNREAARKHPAIDSEPPHFFTEDGSYTNY
ncbi:MAG: mandelate racemase/muconate lactonizing enzyme family protein [Anaerolineales bacterium]|jgi:galactonate dehydratase|nr:mandelate racemase/muconate lactonizing enzyme family protein [Anaerolineales bacterium]